MKKEKDYILASHIADSYNQIGNDYSYIELREKINQYDLILTDNLTPSNLQDQVKHHESLVRVCGI